MATDDPAFIPDSPTTDDSAFTPDMPAQAASPAFGSNRGVAPVAPSTPEVGGNDEMTFAPTDLPPGEAAPDAAARLQDAASPLNPADIAAVKYAQNALTARKVAAVKTSLRGEDFDPSKGLDSAWERMRLGMMNNSVDRAKYLQDKLPAGTDIRIVNPPGVGPMVVFKPPGATSFQPIRGINDTMGRVGDVLSATPAIAAQVGTAAATDGATLLPRLFVQAASGALERGGELVANATGGYDNQSWKGDAGDMARSAAAADAGELGGAALSYAGRTAAGGAGAVAGKVGAPGAQTLKNIGATVPGLMKPTIEGEERLAAEARLRDANPDLTPLAFDQLGHPLAQAKGQRLRAISPILPNISYQQKQTVADMLANAATVNGGKPAITDAGSAAYPGLSDVTSGMKSEAAAPLANIAETEPVEGGRALAQIYQKSIGPVMNRVTDKYGNLMATIKEQPLNLSGAHEAIDKEAAPIYGQGVPEQDLDGGNIVPTDVRTGGGISPAITQPVSALRALNPENGVGPMTERTASPYEAVKPILSQLSEKSVYNPLAPGADRATSNQAAAIVKPLSNAVDEAAGPASSAAKNSRMFANAMLDNPKAITARETAYPEQNMKMGTPENASFLTNTQRLAKATGQSGLYKTFQDAIATGLARQPEKIDALLAEGASSPNTFNRMISPETQPNIIQYGKNTKAYNASLAAKVAKEPDFAKRAAMIADSGDLNGAADIIQRAGGVNSPMADNARAAFYQKMLTDSTEPKSGRIDMGSLATNAGKIADDDAAQGVFAPKALQQLKDIQTYANAANSAGKGMGSSIMASELAEKMSLFRPDKWPGLIAATLEAKIQGKLYTGDRAGIIGRGIPTGIVPRVAGTAAGAYEVNKQRQEPTVGR